MLICPICEEELGIKEGSMVCHNSHSFDIAKEGYVNLLRNTKKGDMIGDDKVSARCRRDFLNKGYYSCLKDKLVEIFSNRQGSLLDICCGEGYYTQALAENNRLCVYGFDISKEMVRLAAKRGKGSYFVANMTAIPLREKSIDFCTHLFAPFCETEFSRVLKDDGELYTVIPGERHLFGLKSIIYDSPYLNDEKLPETNIFKLKETVKLRKSITLLSNEDIEAVFRMTPYFFRTSESDKEKLKKYNTLDTEIEFIIAKYVK